MPNTSVDDNDISILCDIGGNLSTSLDSSKLARVIGLIADGYVRREPKGLELTGKGQELLAERGVGINEA
ncbi:hypothetical protein BH10PSE11_BH10PSE11_21090 [soil metagenome]